MKVGLAASLIAAAWLTGCGGVTQSESRDAAGDSAASRDAPAAADVAIPREAGAFTPEAARALLRP